MYVLTYFTRSLALVSMNFSAGEKRLRYVHCSEEDVYVFSFLLPNALFIYISFHAKDLHERAFNVIQSTYMIYIFIRPK